jgi:hypothetical protein
MQQALLADGLAQIQAGHAGTGAARARAAATALGQLGQPAEAARAWRALACALADAWPAATADHGSASAR